MTGPIRSEIGRARLMLWQAIVDNTDDLLGDDRVHLYVPATLATPCIWLGQPGVNEQVLGSPGAKVRLIRFQVWALSDGYEPAQCALLDDMVGRIWDAAYNLKGAAASYSQPQPVDVGGVSQRGVVTDVGVQTLATSLCPRDLPVLAALA
jgi:hypothetical protein